MNTLKKIACDIYKKRIKDIEDLLKIQCSDGNWNYDPYMHGMSNGMILTYNQIKGTSPCKNPYDDNEKIGPQYLEAPKKWLKDAKNRIIANVVLFERRDYGKDGKDALETTATELDKEHKLPKSLKQEFEKRER